jgi:hypothetical protein
MNTGLVRVTEIAPAIEAAIKALRNVIMDDKKRK